MHSSHYLFHSLLFASCLTVSVWQTAPANSAALYDVTLGTTPPAIAYATTPETVSQFNNCFASQGCFGNAGFVIDVPGGNPVSVGNLPDSFTFNFPVLPQQLATLSSATNTSANLTIVAARDIGLRCANTDPATGACTGFLPGTEYLVASLDGTFVKNFFQDSITTCPAGERGGAGYPLGLVCGPNFHTDISATDAASLAPGLFLADAVDGTLSIVVDPTDFPGSAAGVGRLKIFSVELAFTGDLPGSVPEPGTLMLLGAGLIGFGVIRRCKPRCEA